MTFQSWLHQRINSLPEADKAFELIRLSGKQGIPETAIRSSVKLPKEVVDDLLNAYVSAGQIRVVKRDGTRWYFSQCAL